MNVTETKSEGLSREYRVSVTAAELADRLNARIDELKPKMRLKGFRPGKVPAAHIRKLYGRSLMGEILESTLQESTRKAIADNALRPAAQPQIHFDSPADKVVAGEADLEFHMQLEVMPEFEPVDVSTIAVERMVVHPTEEELAEALRNLVVSNRSFEAREEGAEAVEGDAVVIDFVGRIDGEAFPGGSAEGQAVVLGEGRFIEGFEAELLGAKAGETRELNITFPEGYAVESLAGKPAVFEVQVKEVRAPKLPAVDEDFAKTIGFDTEAALRDAVRNQLAFELSGAMRQQVKRKLLDALDEAHAFDLPANMVQAEFDQIWGQLEKEREAGRLSEEDKAKDEAELRADYRKIAERRVRLGLVLAEIGRRADVQISNEELAAALREQASRFPGMERQVIDFYRTNESALAQLRAPIYEEKVVDLILERAQVIDRPATREELMREIGDEETQG
jgi:trigger factor